MESNSMKSKVELQLSHQSINLNEKEFQTKSYKQQFQSKLDTLESVKIQCDVGYKQENAKLLVKALSSSKILNHVQLISKNETPCKLLPHLTARVSSLEITIPISTNNDPQKVCQAISELKSIEKLALTLNYSTNYKKETFGTFVSHLNLKSNNLTHLSFVLNNIVAHTIDVLSFSQKIAECHQLQYLSIKQEYNGFLLDGIEQLLRNLTTSPFKLQTFKFQFRKIIPTENTIALLREFFKAQPKIETLELIEFSVKTSNLKQYFNEALSQLRLLKQISIINSKVNFFENNIFVIINFLQLQKKSLEKIDITLNQSLTNCEQIVELGSLLEQIPNLNYLCLQFGELTTFKYKSVISFADSIVKCKKLNFLKLNQGKYERLFLKGNSPSETIFQIKNFELEFKNSYQQQKYWEYYYFLLCIANENSEIRQLSISNVNSIFIPAYCKEDIFKLQNEILNKSKNLKDLKLYFSDIFSQNICIIPIQNNYHTLVKLSINQKLSQDLINILRTIPSLLYLSFNNCNQYSLKEILIFFPNLIGIDFQNYYFPMISHESIGYQDLISSNICDIEQPKYMGNKNPVFRIQRTPFECAQHKRSTIPSLFVFEKYIKEYMMSNPYEVVYDIWGHN